MWARSPLSKLDPRLPERSPDADDGLLLVVAAPGADGAEFRLGCLIVVGVGKGGAAVTVGDGKASSSLESCQKIKI